MIDLRWQPALSDIGRDALERFATPVVHLPTTRLCGCTGVSLICRHEATLPDRDETAGGAR